CTAGRSRATFFVQVRIDLGSRCVQRRRETAEHSASQRYNKSEEENVPIQIQRNGADGFVEGQTRANKLNAPIRKQKARSASEKSNQQAFGEQLQDDAQATGSDGHADSQFLSASCRAGQ